jgi:RNA polymerase sporulation-specific sigma factor
MTDAQTMKEKNRYEDNLRLLEASLGGDEAATEELIRSNAGLVRSIAARHLGRGCDAEDLFQIGQIGLLKAIRTFDPGRGCAFSTYAVPLIFGEIRRFLRDDGPIKVSREEKKLAARLAAECEQAFARGEGEIRIAELARRAGVTAEEAASAVTAAAPIRSLAEPLSGEEDGLTLEATLSDEGEAERSLDRLALSAAIDKLPSLWQKIVLLRYFRDLSQANTAAALGLTQVKISREEKKLLAFLREQLS